MAKHKQKSKRKNPARRRAAAKQPPRHEVLPNGDQFWFEDSGFVPDDFVPTAHSSVIIFTSEPQWLRDTVQSYFKRAQHERT